MRRSCIGLLVSSFLAATALQASAERLPVRAYTTADGLGHDRVFCVVQDSRGLLWFCTIDGVSRFDGHRFVNYGEAQGLPAAPAYAFIESRPGVYWVGTHGGLARLDAMVTSSSPGKTPFVEHPLGVDAPSRPILTFLRDRAGRLWAGGEAGLFRIDDEGNDANVRITPVLVAGVDWNSAGRIRAILEDHEGGLWLAADRAIVRRLSDGRVALYAMQTGGRLLKARALLEVEPGTLWIGTGDGLIVLRPELERSARGVDAHAFATARPCPLRPDEPRPSVCEYGTAIGDAGTLIRSLFRTRDGTIWIGAVNGVTSFDGARFRTFDQANGLTNETINAIALDRAGSLWLGTDLGGVLRIAQGVMTTYAMADGLMASDVSQVVEDPSGRLYAVTLRRGLVHRFDGRRFHLVDLHLSKARGADRPAPGRRRDLPRWWLENGASKSLLAEPFDDNQKHVFAVFPDSRGDVWIGEHAADHDTLARWRHETQTLQRFEAGADEPPFDTGDTFDSTLSFAEDAHGSVWIAVVDGGMARFRDDRFVWVRDSAGAPFRNVKSVAADHQGVVWIAAADGIYRVLDPLATTPRAAKLVPASALGRIKCMTVDNAGRIYIGTPNGVEQVDPYAGRIARRYTKADGLAHNEILSAFRDRSGSLWFGTYEGVSRFVPTLEAPEPTPPAFVSAVVVAGRRLMIAELGAARVDGLELAPDERQIQIEFGGLPFGLGDPLRFQYRLLGADDNWTPPDETRITSFAQLGRGAYRFEVRAVTASGRVSAVPAVVVFRVLSPVWARWWFIATLVGMAGLGAHVTYRMRTARLVELERIRTRIAADLHDDIGANLSRIAMMSDVAQGDVVKGNARAARLLAAVASISRESVDAMSDIVWAVDPTRDRIKDLAQRMRRFASDVLSARDVGLTFRSPDSDREWPVRAEVRREVLLIFKEAVNNVARHSGATDAVIELDVERGTLTLVVTDNGRGFDPALASPGNGLTSMRRRAEQLGGTLRVRSTTAGTTVVLRAPCR